MRKRRDIGSTAETDIVIKFVGGGEVENMDELCGIKWQYGAVLCATFMLSVYGSSSLRKKRVMYCEKKSEVV